MAKVVKNIPKDSTGQQERKKVLIFGTNARTIKQMANQLLKEKLLVTSIYEEKKLLVQLHDLDPDIIFLEINALTRKAIEDIVADVFAWMRARARAINKILNSPSGFLWEKSKVILFKSESPLGAIDSLGAEMADTNEVLRKCNLLGNVQFIGIYSPMSFIFKVRPTLVD